MHKSDFSALDAEQMRVRHRAGPPNETDDRADFRIRDETT
jgi:hypothetical protein